MLYGPWDTKKGLAPRGGGKGSGREVAACSANCFDYRSEVRALRWKGLPED